MLVLLDTSHDLNVCQAELGVPVEQLLTPLTRFLPQELTAHFAIDNGGFSGFDRAAFESLLEREWERRHLCRFVAVPDVVASARRTLEAFRVWEGRGTPLVPAAINTTQITSRANQSNPQPGDPCHTLAKGGHPPAIAFDCKASGQNGFGVGEVASTMRSMGHTNSHQNGGGHLAVAIQAGALRENPQSGPDGVGVQEGIAYTLEARAEVQAVATIAVRGRGDGSSVEVREDGIANALLTPSGGRAGIGVGAIQTGMAVRRLTPRECERLQGFPDDYTLIPGAADGPRYKALGNSMAVPVMRWIGKRIQEAVCRSTL